MKRMDAIDANRVFLLSVVLSQGMIYLIAGAGLRDRMVLQFLVQLFIAFPAIAYLSMRKISLKDGLMLQTIGWKELLLLLPLAPCMNRIAEVINVVSQLFTVNTVSGSMAELVLNYPFPFAFFTIALVPAVCEEVVFRGVLYRGYRKCGVWVAILLTAFLFGMAHMNLHQFFYAAVLGVLFAQVNETTGSIVPSVFLHMYINGRSVVNLFLTVKDSKELLQERVNVDFAMVSDYLNSNFPWILAAMVGTVLILFLLKRCKGKEDKREELLVRKEEIGAKEEKGGLLTAISPAFLAGVLICIAYMVLRLQG